MKASKPFLLFAAALSVVGLLVSAFAFGLALPRLTARLQRTTSRAPVVSPEELRAALAAGLRAIGSATAESHTEYYGLSYSTYQRWQLDLALANDSPYPLVLGDDLFLVESNADGSGVEGVAYFRGQASERPVSFGDGSLSALGEWSFEYPFSNYVRVFKDGGRFTRQGGRISLTLPQRRGGREDADFGRLAAGRRTPIRLTLDQGTWLRPETLAGVRVVLPEIAVATAGGRVRFRMTVHLERPSAAGSRRWSVDRAELVRLEPVGLARIVESVDTSVVTRVFAAHWLVAGRSRDAGPVLARACRSLGQGDLLAAALSLLAQVKAADMADRALELLADENAPNGIRHRAAVYLGAIRHAPALAELLRAAKSKDDAVARGAIRGLGGLGGEEAVLALLAALRAGDAERQGLAARALAETGEAAALAELHELASAGRETAFDALVRAARPESFDAFAAMARGRPRKEWRGRLYAALGRSGGARALPLLVESLETDPAPDADDPAATDPLVEAILAVGPHPARDELLRKAEGGNARALQVLAGWKDEAARDVLLRKAAAEARMERLIALDGLARHWPREGRPALRTAAKADDVETAEAGLRGLADAGDAGEVAFLLEQLDRQDERVRRAAASAVERLGPGRQADAVLTALLATGDRTCAARLVDGLVEHDWHDRSAARRIVDRLAARKDDGRYELLRLLRHLSSDALGPASFAEWEKEPESWTARWREWAMKS